jgi:hypothetical protein
MSFLKTKTKTLVYTAAAAGIPSSTEAAATPAPDFFEPGASSDPVAVLAFPLMSAQDEIIAVGIGLGIGVAIAAIFWIVWRCSLNAPAKTAFVECKDKWKDTAMKRSKAPKTDANGQAVTSVVPDNQNPAAQVNGILSDAGSSDSSSSSSSSSDGDDDKKDKTKTQTDGDLVPPAARQRGMNDRGRGGGRGANFEDDDDNDYERDFGRNQRQFDRRGGGYDRDYYGQYGGGGGRMGGGYYGRGRGGGYGHDDDFGFGNDNRGGRNFRRNDSSSDEEKKDARRKSKSKKSKTKKNDDDDE